MLRRHSSDAAAAELLSRHIANLLGARDAIPNQANLARAGSAAFSSTLNRLDTFRLDAPSNPASPERLSVYVNVTYASGSDRGVGASATGLSTASPGADGGGVTVGADYKVTPQVTVGLAFYSGLSDNSIGRTRADLYPVRRLCLDDVREHLCRRRDLR